MIIVTRKLKIIAVLTALIMIPIIGINMSNLSKNIKAKPVNNTVTKSEQTDSILGIQVKSPDAEGVNFFAEYRMERERVRGKETELLREIANNATSDKKARDIASLKLVELTEEAEKEMQAEAMIKSQGFSDCAVIITPKSTTVMLESNNMQIEGQEQIKRAVSIATGCIEKNVSIVKRQSLGQ